MNKFDISEEEKQEIRDMVKAEPEWQSLTPLGLIRLFKSLGYSKAQLQPVPDEKLEKVLRDTYCLHCEHRMYCLNHNEYCEKVKIVSALIKSREGKVAGEIFKELKKPCPDRHDGTEKSDCNDCLDKILARYSPESER